MTLAGARTTLVVDTVSLGEHLHTRLRATPNETLLGKMHVDSNVRAARGEHAYVASDANFDAAFAVTSSPFMIAPRILSHELRRKLLAFRMGTHITFTYERGAIALIWEQAEMNHARLDEAFALMDSALRSVHEAYEAPSQSRIEASPVARRQSPGVEGEPTPMNALAGEKAARRLRVVRS